MIQIKVQMLAHPLARVARRAMTEHG